MAAVKSSKNKTTELRFLRLLRRHSIIGWRRNFKLFGKPDFVFPKEKVTVFIDGCFWHGCNKCRTIPKQNRVFWKRKIQGNIDRDKRVSRRLRSLGWKVIRFREHNFKNEVSVLKKIQSAFKF